MRKTRRMDAFMSKKIALNHQYVINKEEVMTREKEKRDGCVIINQFITINNELTVLGRCSL